MMLRVTVCELNNGPENLVRALENLVLHAKDAKSDLILLPEMGLHQWFAEKREYEPHAWNEAVLAHDEMIERFPGISQSVILGSRPVNLSGKRLNEAFVWEPKTGYRAAHHKYYLPNEEGYWEANWYERGSGQFMPIKTGKALVGFTICSELWFFEHSRAYGKQGAHIIACPRATPKRKYRKWIAGGCSASVVSGAFSISSCPVNPKSKASDLGGHGWVTGPNAEIIAETSSDEPFVTAEIDLKEAELAKQTYPRYITE